MLIAVPNHQQPPQHKVKLWRIFLLSFLVFTHKRELTCFGDYLINLFIFEPFLFLKRIAVCSVGFWRAFCAVSVIETFSKSPFFSSFSSSFVLSLLALLTTPGLSGTLRQDWKYIKFDISADLRLPYKSQRDPCLDPDRIKINNRDTVQRTALQPSMWLADISLIFLFCVRKWDSVQLSDQLSLTEESPPAESLSPPAAISSAERRDGTITTSMISEETEQVQHHGRQTLCRMFPDSRRRNDTSTSVLCRG